jgi:hypothetical protein
MFCFTNATTIRRLLEVLLTVLRVAKSKIELVHAAKMLEGEIRYSSYSLISALDGGE